MNLWTFFQDETEIRILRVVAMALLAGFTNTLLLAIIIGAAQLDEAKKQGLTVYFIAFLATIVLYIVSQRFIMRVSNTEIESVMGRLRFRIANKIRKADLLPIEGIGSDQIYSVISRDTQIISQVASPTITAIQSSIMVPFTSIYIASLDPYAFLLALLISGLGIIIHFRKWAQIVKDVQEASARENEFFGMINHLLAGFKEVKLNTDRSRDLHNALSEMANTLIQLKIKTGSLSRIMLYSRKLPSTCFLREWSSLFSDRRKTIRHNYEDHRRDTFYDWSPHNPDWNAYDVFGCKCSRE